MNGQSLDRLATLSRAVEEPEIYYINQNKVQTLSFLDIKIIIHEDNSIETDIYYKPNNTHDYLPYDSAHPEHIKNNLKIFSFYIKELLAPEILLLKLRT